MLTALTAKETLMSFNAFGFVFFPNIHLGFVFFGADNLEKVVEEAGQAETMTLASLLG